MDGHHYDFIGMHFFWWFFWLILIGPLFFTATPFGRRKTARLYGENPLGNLQRRYAAGQITGEQYEVRKFRIEYDLREPEIQ